MKKIIIALLVCIFLTGCFRSFRSAEYYTDPNSKGYFVSEFGAMCSYCSKDFTASMHQLDNAKTANCPFCGVEQNLEEATKRYANKHITVNIKK